MKVNSKGHVGEVFARLKEGVEKIEARIPFSSDERLGMLTFCPTNLGTTIRASVHVKLPKLAAGGQDQLQAVADQFQLQVRGSAGEHSEAVGGLYDISNRERMGLTEFQVIRQIKKWFLITFVFFRLSRKCMMVLKNLLEWNQSYKHLSLYICKIK